MSLLSGGTLSCSGLHGTLCNAFPSSLCCSLVEYRYTWLVNVASL